MRKIPSLAFCFLAAASTAALAQPTPQQERMKTCNETATQRGLKGDERMDYMGRCLRGDTELTAQQDRMRMCNVQASERQLKGEARTAFMSDCLRNHEKLTARQEKMKADKGRSAATGR